MNKILVIEDESQVRENIQQILELSDYSTLSAEDGIMGIEIAQGSLPDLIICDIMMPKMNGYGVLNQIRQNPSTANIPLIFLTAKSERSDFRKGMELGADDYVTKPFTSEELLTSVNTRLAKMRAINSQYQKQVEKAEFKADYLSYHDSLTGLPNHFFLQQEFYRLKRLADLYQQKIPLLIMGFPQFNHLNLTLGERVTTSLIQGIAKRLTGHFSSLKKPSPHLIHLGSDRFLLMGENSSNENQALELALNCFQALCHSFNINNHEIFITPNLGIVIYEKEEQTLDQLLTHAEIARNQAQKIGGNNYQFYDHNLDQNCSRKLILETDLHYALTRNQLSVYYQPQVDLWTGKIIGIEALMRWNHPKLGFISPCEFIAIAEETGLIISLGEWILSKACNQFKALRQLHINPLKISVNLSPYQFRQPNLCEKIEEIIKDAEMDPHFLELELTESVILDDLAQAQVKMSQLKALGVNIAIDDFGTGYSSLKYLQSLPFDTIKIDQTFIRNINHNSSNLAITKAIITMACALNLNVIAEGIETTEELGFLRLNHCQFGQGFLFYKPLPENKLALLLCLN